MSLYFVADVLTVELVVGEDVVRIVSNDALYHLGSAAEEPSSPYLNR